LARFCCVFFAYIAPRILCARGTSFPFHFNCTCDSADAEGFEVGAGEAGHVRAQAEADDVEAVEELARSARPGGHVLQHFGQTLARLPCVDHGAGVAGQVGVGPPVQHHHVRVALVEIG